MTSDPKAFSSLPVKNGLGYDVFGWWGCVRLADCTTNSSGSASRRPRGSAPLPEFQIKRDFMWIFQNVPFLVSTEMSHNCECVVKRKFMAWFFMNKLQKILFTNGPSCTLLWFLPLFKESSSPEVSLITRLFCLFVWFYSGIRLSSSGTLPPAVCPSKESVCPSCVLYWVICPVHCHIKLFIETSVKTYVF